MYGELTEQKYRNYNMIITSSDFRHGLLENLNANWISSHFKAFLLIQMTKNIIIQYCHRKKTKVFMYLIFSKVIFNKLMRFYGKLHQT